MNTLDCKKPALLIAAVILLLLLIAACAKQSSENLREPVSSAPQLKLPGDSGVSKVTPVNEKFTIGKSDTAKGK